MIVCLAVLTQFYSKWTTSTVNACEVWWLQRWQIKDKAPMQYFLFIYKWTTQPQQMTANLSYSTNYVEHAGVGKTDDEFSMLLTMTYSDKYIITTCLYVAVISMDLDIN